MGLATDDQTQRKEIRVLAGKSDWKAAVKTPDDAKILVQKLKGYAVNYHLDANLKLKVTWLERYIQSGSGVTFKEYVKENKNLDVRV